MGSGGGHGCAGINAAWAQDQQVRVGVLVYSDVGKRKGYEPDQITLTNGNKHMVQAVGPADISMYSPSSLALQLFRDGY